MNAEFDDTALRNPLASEFTSWKEGIRQGYGLVEGLRSCMISGIKAQLLRRSALRRIEPEIHPRGTAIHICLITLPVVSIVPVVECKGATNLVASFCFAVAGILPRLVHLRKDSCSCGAFLPINEALRLMAPLHRTNTQASPVLAGPFIKPPPQFLFTTQRSRTKSPSWKTARINLAHSLNTDSVPNGFRQTRVKRMLRTLRKLG